MNPRKNIIFGLIVLLFFACTNGKKNQSQLEIENQSQNSNWIETEIKKQLRKNDTQDSIEIYGLPIEDIPILIYQYPNIKYLKIDCTDFNCMKSLSSRVSEFKNLETLIISKSALTKLPKQIGELTNLKKLIISGGGQLKTIPNELSKLNKLEELDLWRNNLSEFSIELNNMKNLKTIYLGENKFPKNYIKVIAEKSTELKIKMNR